MIWVLIPREELGSEVPVVDRYVMSNKGTGSRLKGAGSLAEGSLVTVPELVLLPWEDEGQVQSQEE